jgi:hypothetical protein
MIDDIRTRDWSYSGRGGAIQISLPRPVELYLDISESDTHVYRIAPSKKYARHLGEDLANGLCIVGYRTYYNQSTGVTWIASKGNNDLTFLSLYYSDRAITQHHTSNAKPPGDHE